MPFDASVSRSKRRCPSARYGQAFSSGRYCADLLVDHRNPVRRVGKLLHDLQGAVHREPLALRVDVVHQRAGRRRLAALPLRVHDEVRHVPDEAHDVRDARRRRQHVMLFRIARPRDVEDLAHAADYTKIGNFHRVRTMHPTVRAPCAGTRRWRRPPDSRRVRRGGRRSRSS